MKPVMLIDINSVGHAANSMKRMGHNGMDTQAILGTINSVRHLISKNIYHHPIVLWDAKSVRRGDLYPEYKASRKLPENPKQYQIDQAVLRGSYKKQRPYIFRALSYLGIQQITPVADEADDFAGFISRKVTARGGQTLLVSRDHDWAQLVNKNVSWLNLSSDDLINNITFKGFSGFSEPQKFLEKKALMGDKSDNITGVGGIGEKCASLILEHYPSVEHLIAEVQAADISDLIWVPPPSDIEGELKRFRKKIIAFGLEPDIFHRNIQLMDLINCPDPKPATYKISNTMLSATDTLSLCRRLGFMSILDNQSEWLEPFLELEKRKSK